MKNMQTLDGKHSAGHWSGRFGFLMAAVGSAVGLGNIWRFPYLAGAQGGALFLIAYVVLILVVGFSLMIAEFAIGRSAAKNVVDAFGARKKGWGVVGVIGCVASFVIVSYYCVIGGWIMRYAAGYFDGGSFVAGGDYAEVFASFTGNSWEPVVCMLVFMAVCLVIILMGVKNGIERINKVLMPLLFVMLLFVMIVSLTMDGAVEGVKFFIVPDMNRVEKSDGIMGIFLAALGQAFYSLSLGLGIATTYGSYAKKDISLTANTVLICVSDTLVAMIAGFAILPAVFAAGQQPTVGPGLVFVTLPAVFATLPPVLGSIVGVVFFLLVLFAAITSAIALIEVNGVGYFPDAPTERGVKHLQELTRAQQAGVRCGVAFVIQMERITEVRPNVDTHPAFGVALAQAKAAGVKVFFLLCRVGRDALDIVDQREG